MLHFLVTMMQTTDKKIDEILTRGVGEFIDPDGSFREKLIEKSQGKYNKDIVVKFGVDPTQPDIHLGHAVILHKLRQLQDIGCKVIFLVGDFTAKIGDPTGKSKTRPEVEQHEIEKNMKTYLDQIHKILRTEDPVFSWIRNSDWFISPLDLVLPEDYKISLKIKKDEKEIEISINPNSIEGRAIAFQESRMQKTNLKKEKIENVSITNLLWTLKKITHGRLIQRDLFKERIHKGEELYLHEMLYPIFQGIDSHVLAKIYGSCDMEIGGTDQTFNMLIGRDIMKNNKQEPQAVLSIKLLEGTDGKEKMSKSLDNYIEIAGDPNDMYGKIMSIPDASLVNYFKLTTYTSESDIERIKKDLEKKTKNPRDIKMRLAKEITSIYHGEKIAESAQDVFIKTFQKGMLPENISESKVSKDTNLFELLVEKKIIKSKTELRRLIEEGAISNIDTKEKISDADFQITKSINLKIGKKHFLKIIVLDNE